MGYKLAGFDVLGCNEIDPRMARAYVANHHPKYCFLEPIQDFVKRKHFPPELYDLDILDGSPPCSSFSMAGEREKKWGVKKRFREGQQEQVLDTLFFDFIALAGKLRPRVCIAENVKGMLAGTAMRYVERVVEEFEALGYTVQYQLLDASKMGVPQRRQRVFFIAIRNDIHREPVQLRFNQKPVIFDDIYVPDVDSRPVKHGKLYSYWKAAKPEDRTLASASFRVCGRRVGHCFPIMHRNEVLPTLVAAGRHVIFDEFRALNDEEQACAGSWPQDYDYAGNPKHYIIGMSVPPLMTYGVADAIYNQVLRDARPTETVMRPAIPPRLLRNQWLQAGKWSYDPNDI